MQQAKRFLNLYVSFEVFQDIKAEYFPDVLSFLCS